MSVYTGLRFPMAVATHLYIYVCCSDTFVEFPVDTTSVGAVWEKQSRVYECMSVSVSVCPSVCPSVDVVAHARLCAVFLAHSCVLWHSAVALAGFAAVAVAHS